jgi:peptidoglycan biosynthesis protein MviN/MurJ (putative lipid II flippase)
MTGEEHTAMSLTIGACLLNLAGNVALIPLFGLPGAAAATAISCLVMGGASLWWLRRSGRLGRYFVGIRDIVLAAIVSSIITALLDRWLDRRPFLALAGVVAAAYAAYVIVVVICCRVEDEALDSARALLRRSPIRSLRLWRL